MANFLTLFPKVNYDVTRGRIKNYELGTNITFRINIIKDVLSNFASYFEYDITDSDTPEILADKFYRDTEAHWIILYANNMYDPQYDWPLNYKNFNKYIEVKYGSIAWSKTNIHHHEKVIERTVNNNTTTTRFQINEDDLTTAMSPETQALPFDSYDNLPVTQQVYNYSVSGKTVTEVIYRNAVSYYDYENELNEAKRSIKVIKREYYPQIIEEFKALTRSRETYLRDF
jgi:hypothetical protein